MENQSDPLSTLLAQIEARQELESEDSIADQIRRVTGRLRSARDIPAELDTALLAEAIGFEFRNDPARSQSGWGTYYGPMAVLATDRGDQVEIPDIQLVTDAILRYWEKRALECVHPVMRGRYADLVWDFSKKVTGKTASVVMPQIVIDSTMEIAKWALVEHAITTIKRLQRALALALSIGDKERIQSMADTIIRYEDSVAKDHLPGLWGFSFDALVDQKRITLSPRQEERIVQDLEARLKRVSQPTEEGALDPFSAEPAALRLAKYYRRRERHGDVQRVLTAYGSAFGRLAESASALGGSSWLKDVFKTYSEFGMQKEADEIAHRLRDVSARVEAEMVAFSTRTNIARDDLDRYLASIMEGDLEQVLIKTAGQFLPHRDQAASEVMELAKEAPIQAVVTHTIQDHDGRVVAQVGSVEDDFDGRVVLQISQHMQFEAPFLALVFDRMRSVFSPKPEHLLEVLLKSPLFEASRSQILMRGLGAYLRNDHVVAACVLVPEIEAAVRRLLTLNGGSIYRQAPNGGLLLRSLDQMLRDPAVTEPLGEDGATYLRILLTDPRGWNLRNTVCHGFLPSEAFGPTNTNRLLHALLVLGMLRTAPPSPKSTTGEQTTQGDEDPIADT